MVRTSARGAFFLEPMVERDMPQGRMAWPHARPDDIERILAGEGGMPVEQIPFLARQNRVTFANFGMVPKANTPAELAALIKSEAATWGPIIRSTGFKPLE